jgi:hypothetical protein
LTPERRLGGFGKAAKRALALSNKNHSRFLIKKDANFQNPYKRPHFNFKEVFLVENP